MGRWHLTKPDKHFELAVDVALCHNAYEDICLEAPNIAATTKTLVGADGEQIKLDGVVFLKLTLGDTMSNHLWRPR